MNRKLLIFIGILMATSPITCLVIYFTTQMGALKTVVAFLITVIIALIVWIVTEMISIAKEDKEME